MIICFGKDSKVTERYQFESAQIERLMRPKELGLTADFYGGRVTKIARVKNSPVLIFANDENVTIDTGFESERIKELEVFELKRAMRLIGVDFDVKIGNREKLLSILGSATGETPDSEVSTDAR